MAKMKKPAPVKIGPHVFSGPDEKAMRAGRAKANAVGAPSMGSLPPSLGPNNAGAGSDGDGGDYPGEV